MHSDTTATTINPEASLSVPIWRRMLVYGVFGIFALWCLLAFRRDIAQIDLTPLRAGWLAVLAAGG